MFGNRVHYTAEGASFAELLDWHLEFGTRPEGQLDRPSKRWNNKEFAEKVGVTDKTVRNWRAGRNPPQYLGNIERVLFGVNASYDVWRIDLRLSLGCKSAPLATEYSPIPRPPTYFIGRTGEVADLLAWLNASGGPILVQGGPGHGKTALTLALANNSDIVTQFGAMRWFVALDTARTDAALRSAVISAIGSDPDSGFRAAITRLAAQPGLLVLDNLETPWEPIAERRAVEGTLAELAAVPGLALLASFRGREPVGGPAWRVRFVEHLAPPYDTELFLRHAHSIRADDPDLLPLVKALGGIPLAIELVAAQAYGLDELTSLRQRWDAVGVDLAVHPDFPSGPLTSLPHSIELSLRSERLNEPSRYLFQLLGQLPAGLCSEDRDALLGNSGFDAERRIHRVGLAVSRGGRIDLLSPVRNHAFRYHKPKSENSQTWLAHFLALSRVHGELIGTGRGIRALARLLPELYNIEAAIIGALSIGLRTDVMNTLSGFRRLLYFSSSKSSIIQEILCACEAEGDFSGMASCGMILGDLSRRYSEYQQALDQYSKAIKSYRNGRDKIGEAKCLRHMGDIERRRSNFDTAKFLFLEAIGVLSTIKTPSNEKILTEATCIKYLADVELACKKYEDAKCNYNLSKSIYARIDNLLGTANCLRGLGEVEKSESRYDQAKIIFQEAYCIYVDIEDNLGMGNCMQNFADIAFEETNFGEAENFYETALIHFRFARDILGEANCEVGFGNINSALHDRVGAMKNYEKALTLYKQIEDNQRIVNCKQKIAFLSVAL